jgi:hypothetical protein
MDDLADRRHERGHLTRMSNHQILRVEPTGEGIGRLCSGKVHLRLAGSLQPADLDVADHANDRASVVQVLEGLADRILAGPVTLDK